MTIYQSNAALAAHDRETWNRQWLNAANAETLEALDADLRRLRLLAHIARAKGQRVDIAGAAAEIVAAAAERLGER